MHSYEISTILMYSSENVHGLPLLYPVSNLDRKIICSTVNLLVNINKSELKICKPECHYVFQQFFFTRFRNILNSQTETRKGATFLNM